MTTFSADISRWVGKTKKRMSDIVGLTVVMCAAELDFRSPVGDASYWKRKPPKGYVGGHFRANWRLGVDVRPSGEVAGADRSGKNRERGGTTTAAIAMGLPGDDMNGGHVYYIVNNAPYAQRLEDGWSRQAPQGMLGLTAAMFPQIVRKAVRQAPE